MSDGSEEQALIKNLSDIEMKINNLMNFVTEKEESGEGISTAEDAEQLMDGMADIEENL